MVVFVVKRYAVREAKKWRYAVRKAKVGRYAVRKGGGGCHPQLVTTLSNLEPTDTNKHAILQVIDLIIIAYGIKSKVFKQSSSVGLHIN